MKTTLDKTMLDLRGLSASSRALVAKKLLASLEDNEPSKQMDKAWNQEALKRYRNFKAGKATTKPHDEVMRAAYRLVEA